MAIPHSPPHFLPSLKTPPIPTLSPSVLSAVPNAAVASGSSPLRVAFQGAPAAYSEFAAKTAIPNCSTLPCRSFSDAISSLHRLLADRAILPVESTLEGTALRNYDLLLRHDLHIVQEINLFVHYCLLAIPDTTGAVEILRNNHLLDTAAIASPRAALLYGLNVLAHGLQDTSWNVTRFLILSKHPSSSTPTTTTSINHRLKTSMVIAHRGAAMMVILKILSAFSSRNLNLTKLEVINPAINDGKGPVMILDVRGKGSLRAFPHVLYVDFEGSLEDSRVNDAIDDISKVSVFVRILGTYSADPNVYDLH
ncbi:hypothetical protein J5N97_025237 [Dioscorea zingiberensis]|uniref:prephenate dehydratase n=1 Tax=Dioscorea zingiberensis TaxID=325984 RepID=A0A9D5C933_9LILI|nr:hypothetical protein J5N97_025237 [Dioscorea zingiberensis]